MQLTAAEQGLHLEKNLTAFTAMLRGEGLPVGTAELIDALQALQRIDLSSRDNFKTALQATMVKSRRDQAAFSRLFDQFFIPPAKRRSLEEELARHREEFERRLEEASRELHFKGEVLQLSSEELRQYSALPAEQRNQIREFMAKTEQGKNVEAQFRPILETIVKSHLRYRRSLEERSQRSPAYSGTGEGAGEGADFDALLREVDIAAIATADLPVAEQLLQRLSRKLAVKILRRRRGGPRSGPLDLRRSLRDNMRFGGIIFNIKRRPRRRSRQQILLLCDVSASMKSYSTFVIHFLHGLQEAVKDLSCFSFADNIEDLSAELKGKPALNRLLDRVIRRSNTWGGGTNIGQALHKLMAEYPERANMKTTLIVVSDTKTVALEKAIRELKRLKERVRRVIWLNPLPVDRWPDYRSVGLFAAVVEMWPCSTIAQLEEVLAGRL